MWRAGRILKLRKTPDGRYAVAYRVPAGHAGAGPRNRVLIGRHVHLAMGYPASRYLDDLQAFKRANPESDRVVNAYEPHDEIYQQLERAGGIVLVRGRGIVASRIIQRLWEARRKNKAIQALHIMRSRIAAGQKYGLAQRLAVHDVEYQPFNWPKSCWGGTFRRQLERSDPDQRLALMKVWGGTTTADRSDWEEIISEGKEQGWYRPFFGDVTAMRLTENGLETTLASTSEFKEEVRLEANFVIDCTGLVADITANPVLKDLIDIYALERNRVSGRAPEQRLSGLKVTNAFEVEGLRNGTGRAYASGVLTVNGPYAAVDSFLGLQYTALRSVDDLAAQRAAGVSRFGPIRSARQWVRWCRGRAP